MQIQPPDREPEQRRAIESLQVQDLTNRVRTRGAMRWLGVTWAGLATLALGVVLIGVLIVFIISLIQGHPVDSWLRGLTGSGGSIVQASAPLRGVISLCSLVAAIVAVAC